MAKRNQKEYLTVSVILKVNGKIKRLRKKTYYGRRSESHCFNLNDFAQVIFMWDKIFSRQGSTFAYDGLLQEAAKKLPKKDGETAESVFNKYWVNLNETIEADFLSKNKGGKGNFLFPVENDYLKYLSFTMCNSFSRNPLPVKYAFLYWFFKYVMNGSIKEIEAELNNVPDDIKKMVDSFLSKQNG